MTRNQPEPIVSIGEAQAFLRIETGEEEAILAGLIRTASSLCEAFLNQVLISQPFTEVIAGGSEWKPLVTSPVRSVTEVIGLVANGSSVPLSTDAYGIDIDSCGRGWVRVTGVHAPSRLRVEGIAGMADDQNGVPEPIRQGVLRLVAHLYSSRDGSDDGPPAAVTALWRPYRQLRFA